MKRLFNICLCVCALALASCVNNGKVNDAGNNAPSDEKGALVLNVATRTAEGEPQRDYILCIYKTEDGKQTLVRKYDSSRDDMQKPEYIWLLEGNYKATIESGVVVACTFNEAEHHFIGEEDFAITGGQTTTVDLVAVRQNIPVEVIFDQTIVNGEQGKFLDGYYVEVKANDKVKLTYTESKKGYFIMPEGVNTLSWNFVGTFEYEDGEQVSVNKSGAIENVQPKRSYKLSFKYSKDASGFLGGLNVTVDESVEERDDHLAFNPDPELKGVDFDLSVPCNYVGGERKYYAKSPAEFCAVTLAADGKEFNPVESPIAGITLEGLNTSELYITLSEDFFYSLNGGAQIIELCVTDAGGGEARKELPYNLPGINSYDKSLTNLWRGTAVLSATVFGSPSSVNIAYRQGEGEWQSYAAQSNGGNLYTAQISGISASSSYEYRLEIGEKVVGAPQTFTTELGAQIPNGDMETWSQSGKTYYPGASANNKYWDTGNKGTTTVGNTDNNLTSKSTDVRPGTKGSYSAFLDSKVVMGKFGAGNIFVGSFGKVVITSLSATVYFGQPFTFNAKPKGVRMWVKYNCGSIDNVGSVGKKGDPDLTKIFCCICNWNSAWCVDSDKADATTFSPSMENIRNCTDGRYSGVLYTAYFDTNTSNNEWHELYIPFEKIEGADDSKGANYLVLTATCSGYGDFFTGSADSWMYLDDIELVY